MISHDCALQEFFTSRISRPTFGRTTKVVTCTCQTRTLRTAASCPCPRRNVSQALGFFGERRRSFDTPLLLRKHLSRTHPIMAFLSWSLQSFGRGCLRLKHSTDVWGCGGVGSPERWGEGWVDCLEWPGEVFFVFRQVLVY